MGMQVAVQKCFLVLVLFLILLVSAACGGGGGSAGNIVQAASVNSAPSANAGADQAVKELTAVILSGTSTDADGDTISYSWTQIAGPDVTVAGEDSSTLEFTAPDVSEGSPQILTFRFTATDAGGLSNSDEVQVTVEDPIAEVTTYCHGAFNKLFITNDDGLETYEVVVQELDAARTEAIGARNDNSLSLEATIDDFSFSYDFAIADDESTITAKVDVAFGNKTIEINEYGTLGDCTENEGGISALPKVVANDFTNVGGFIEDISYFRSSAGHDYSDSFESCRSMKHYFSPREEERKNSNVPVFSPYAGTIVQLNTEEGKNFEDDGKTNQRTIVRSSTNPAVLAVIFHVDFDSDGLAAGSTVEAGQQLGYARMERKGSVGHDFDIAMHLNTEEGVHYVSYFDLLDDDVFSGYNGFGNNRSDFIITESQRDADPLSCDGETFTSEGSLSRWIFNI